MDECYCKKLSYSFVLGFLILFCSLLLFIKLRGYMPNNLRNFMIITN